MIQKAIFLLLATTYAFNARAVPPGDLYCEEIPPFQPIVFEGAALTCEKGKAPTEKANICVENVKCAYVSAEMKKNAKDSDNKKAVFEKLTAAERTNYLKTVNVEAFPTMLTCPLPVGASTCPDPNECNGDQYYKGRMAHYSPEKEQKIFEHQRENINNLYPAATKKGD